MSRINILLVEDDFLNRRLIKKVLLENNYQVSEAKNMDEALESLHRGVPDVAILDINLGETEKSGINIGQIIKDQFAAIPFIYLTAYDTSDIVKKAINTAPCSYLTKPFKNVDLLASVEIALQQSFSPENPHAFLVVKDEDFNLKLPLSEIDYIESEGNYLMIFRQGKMYKFRSTIKQILDEFPASNFIQTHRAFVVNKSKIEKFSHKEIIVNGAIVPISKSFFPQLKAELLSFNEKN